MTWLDYRELGRRNWGRESPDGIPSREDIQFGAILRIADGVEAMAKYHVTLIRDRDHYEREYNRMVERHARLERQMSALRGVLTKTRKARDAELAQARIARPLDEWHEDIGDALWWKFPVEEAPYCGSPLDTGWPGYHTHWTPIALPKEPTT